MSRRIIVGTLGAGALAVAGLVTPGTAAAAALNGLSPVTGPYVKAATVNGSPAFVVDGERFGLELVAAVLDDAGAPVTGCLASPAMLRVTNPAGKEVGTSSCASSVDGLFHVVTSGIVRPGAYTATLDTATTFEGQVLTGVAAAIGVYVVPRMEKIAHFSVRGTTYPVEGRLRIPNAPTAGAFVLERKRKGVWKRVGTQKPTRTGKWLFPVRVTSTTVRYWRVRFVPKPATMWLAPKPVLYGLYRS